MTTIRQTAGKDTKRVYEQFERELDNSIALNELIDRLPALFTEKDWGESTNMYLYNSLNGGIDVDITFYMSDEKINKTIQDIKDWLGKTYGWSFDKIAHSYSDRFEYSGEFIYNSIHINLHLKGLPAQPGCVLKKVTKWTETTQYEAECIQTGEEI